MSKESKDIEGGSKKS